MAAGGSAGRAEVAVPVDERVAQRERLAHADQRVVDGDVAVRVVLAHDLADEAAALHEAAVGRQVHEVGAPEDAPVHGLEAVAGVGQGPVDDDRHGVLEERRLELRLDLASRVSGRFSGRGPARQPRVTADRLRCPGSGRRWRCAG